jgi:heme/copper-type cytochrome/quinol oxidase subunit 2
MKRIAPLAVLILIVIASGCSKQPSVPTPSGIGPDGMSGTLTSDVRQVNIVASSATIKPEKVYVRKGDDVRLYVTSTDASHTFVIDRLNITGKLVPGKTVLIEFTPGGSGDYPYHFADDKKTGGTLIVVP